MERKGKDIKGKDIKGKMEISRDDILNKVHHSLFQT